MKDLTPTRAFGLALALPQTVIGVWAVLSPRGWYDSFPGFGPALAAAEPPFNEHLITDAGAGFLATGGLLVGVCLFGGPAEMRIAAIGYLLFCVPHLVYHALNPSPLLPAFNDVLNVVLIGAQVAGGATLIVLTTHRKAVAWAS
ncbi:hypothetical protein D0Z08_19075 [Nocardioides immobilis]|uniref:DoxX family membrane protein n=1 Tax=Nocardioides immobilis TaxID=2049295 RepID=A0A417XZ16_9ACTN|nr:hypothetical protein [Nocardioides immobilis]RHW25606.1 hypothetical protein D0Z08_19075 [Nocardioides immobilis]